MDGRTPERPCVGVIHIGHLARLFEAKTGLAGERKSAMSSPWDCFVVETIRAETNSTCMLHEQHAWFVHDVWKIVFCFYFATHWKPPSFAIRMVWVGYGLISPHCLRKSHESVRLKLSEIKMNNISEPWC